MRLPGRRGDLGDRRPRCSPPPRSSTCCAAARGRPRGAARLGAPVALAGAARRLAALRRRRPLRDPRHQLQPGHVPAPAGAPTGSPTAHGSQLLTQGYPLGPHSVVVALHKGLGIGLVQGFDGLTVAVAVLACLTALGRLRRASAPPARSPARSLVGLAYMVASYFAQGAFKETMQALFVLAFASRCARRGASAAWRELPLRFVPAALIAVGTRLRLQLPGPDLAGGDGGDLGRGSGCALRRRRRPPAPAPWRARRRSALLAFVVLVAPEIGRMIDFHNFETFDPNGPGLGNLFGQISPFEALGIWPSGDFRLAPGDGAVPALGYYLGAALALVLLALRPALRCWRRREYAILAGAGSRRSSSTPPPASAAPPTPRPRRSMVAAGGDAADRPPAARSCGPPLRAAACGDLAPLRPPPSSSPPAPARCSPSPTPRSGRPPTRRR